MLLWGIAMVVVIIGFLVALMRYIFSNDAKKKKSALEMLVVFLILTIIGLGTCFVTLQNIKIH